MALPANVVKVTIMFDMLSRGWSETFWVSGLSTNLNDYVQFVNNVCNKRRLLLCSVARLYAFRISFESDSAGNPLKGDSILTYFNQFGNTSNVGTDPDLAAMIVYRSANASRHKNQFLRGIPDGVQNPNGQYNPNLAGWSTNLAAYFVALTAGQQSVVNAGVGWVSHNIVYTDTIVDYVVNSSNQVVLTIANGVVFKPTGLVNTGRQMIRVAGLNGKSTLNGQLLVVPNSSVEFTTVRPIAVTPYKLPGIVSFYDAFYTPAPSYAVQKIVSRRTGAPFLQPRGRARVRVRT